MKCLSQGLSRRWRSTTHLLAGLSCASAMSPLLSLALMLPARVEAQVVYLHRAAGIPTIDAVTSYTGHPDKKAVVTVDVKSSTGAKGASDGESDESDTSATPSPAIPVIHMAGDRSATPASAMASTIPHGAASGAASASHGYSELVTSGGVADSRDNAVIASSEFGTGVPLSMALSSIVPQGFTVAYASVDQNKPVNWAGGHGWRDTLVSLCSAYGYHVQWVPGRTVVISGSASDEAAGATDTSAHTASTQTGLTDKMIPVGLSAHNEQIVTPTQVSSSRNIQGDVLDQREGVHQTTSLNRDGAEIVQTNRAPMNTTPGVIMTKRQMDGDGDLLIPNSKSALMENMPSMSYAPKNGGNGIYYAAAGQDLYQVLCVWAGANGWKVDYRDVKMRYPIYEEVSLRGDFHSVAKTLIHSIHATPMPHPMFYNGNKTLRIYNYEPG